MGTREKLSGRKRRKESNALYSIYGDMYIIYIYVYICMCACLSVCLSINDMTVDLLPLLNLMCSEYILWFTPTGFKCPICHFLSWWFLIIHYLFLPIVVYSGVGYWNQGLRCMREAVCHWVYLCQISKLQSELKREVVMSSCYYFLSYQTLKNYEFFLG